MSVFEGVHAGGEASVWRMRKLTDTCGHSAVPLGQGTGHGLTPDGVGAVQRVAWIAFKQHHHTDAKVVPYPLSKAGLRDRATLRRTCPGDSYRRGEEVSIGERKTKRGGWAW